MSTTVKIQFLSEQCLGRDNWIEWRDRIILAARQRGLLGHLTGDTPRPTLPEAVVDPDTGECSPTDEQLVKAVEATTAWEKDDIDAVVMLRFNIKDWLSTGIEMNDCTARECWAELCRRRERVDEIAAMNAEDYLRRCRMAENGDIQKHFDELRSRYYTARATGSKLSPRQYASIIMQSMPDSLQPFIAGFALSSDPEDVFSGIISIHQQRQVRAGKTVNPFSVTSSSTSDPKALLAQTIRLCDWCGLPKHSKANCFTPGGGKEGQQPSTWRNPIVPKAGTPADQLIKSRGASTPSAMVATSSAPNSATSSASVAHHANFTASGPRSNWDVDICLFAAFITTAQASELVARAYIDSGASHHYFVDRAAFVEYYAITPRYGKSAQGTFTISGMGTVHISTMVDGRRSFLVLKDVYHTPDLTANLISSSRLDRSGFWLTSGNGVMDVYREPDRRVVLRGTLTHYDLYVVDLIPVEEHISRTFPTVDVDCDFRAYAVSQTQNALPADLATWHRRLGHLGESVILQMARGKIVNGLDLTSTLPIGKCEDCIFGKQSRDPFYESVVETNPLERLYVDLMGKFRTKTLGGGLYLMTIDDGGTSNHANRPLPSKDAEVTLAYLKEFIAMAERQTGFKTKAIRTDGGTEFCNELWDDFFRETGIVHEVTNRYTPQQNGVAERVHRTLADSVRAMLHDSNLPTYLWGEAFNFKAYVKNLSASARQKGMTPFERWTGTKPNIAHLRPFGTVGYVKIPDEIRTKLDDKSALMYLVGYEGTSSYRMWNPVNRKVIRAREVLFQENDPHRTLPAQCYQPNADEVTPLFDDVNSDDDIQVPITTEPYRNAHISPVSTRPPSPAPQPSIPNDNVELHPAEEELRARGEPGLALPPSSPPPPRRSERIRERSRARVESDECLERERIAKAQGDAWADDGPAALLTRLSDHPNEDYKWEEGETPTSYKEASKELEIWEPAMKKEYDGLVEIGAWHLVPRTSTMNVVECKWAFARKFDEESRWKAKARLVAKGFQQIPGVDFFETHASVVRFDSLRALCALSANRGMHMAQADIEKAYLNASPDTPIFMEQPPGFVDKDRPDHVCAMDLNLYGFMQAGHLFWKHLDNSYKDLGFTNNRADECVRVRKNGDDLAVTATYTDDITQSADTKADLAAIKRDLGGRYKLSAEGEFHYMLGVTVERDMDEGWMRLSQRSYAERVLERFGMGDCNSVSTPLDPSVRLVKSDSNPTDAERAEMSSMSYLEALGCIMYLAVATRPDLMYPVQLLSRFMTNPGISHWRALKRLLRYIQGSLNHSITYYRDGLNGSTLQPIMYSDSSHGDCLDSGRSTQGYVAVMAGGPISWSARRQDVVALSTVESEYIAIVHASCTLLWIEKFMMDLHIKINLPLVVRTDNRGAENVSKRSMTKMRHLRVRYYWVREAVRDKLLDVIHIPGIDNPADIFTKPLSYPTLHQHLKFLRIIK